MSYQPTDGAPPTVVSIPIPTGAITLGPMAVTTTRDERRFRAAVQMCAAMHGQAASDDDPRKWFHKVFAEAAVMQADALLAELERTKP